VCACGKRALGIERFIVLGKNQDAGCRRGSRALRHQVGAAAAAEHQVEDHDVGPFARDQLQGLRRRTGFTNDGVTPGLLDDRAQAHAHDRVVVDDH